MASAPAATSITNTLLAHTNLFLSTRQRISLRVAHLPAQCRPPDCQVSGKSDLL